jgi:hypothetical protein
VRAKEIVPHTRVAWREYRRMQRPETVSRHGEHRLPVAIAVAVAIALQLTLSERLSIHPIWLLPTLEGLILAGLIAANPRHITRTSGLIRTGSVLLIALLTLANGFASGELIGEIVTGASKVTAPVLLARAAAIYVTNVIAFALWYWEWDRGGPVRRLERTDRYPDFLFPQMTRDGLAPPEWIPTFLDYLYVSFTNATAFSPTDTMPLSRWSKMLMMLQSTISLLTVAFVVARAINILQG